MKSPTHLSASLRLCVFGRVGGFALFEVQKRVGWEICFDLCDLWAFLVVTILEVVGGSSEAIQAVKTICVYLRDLRFKQGGWADFAP